jgi:hypothetical protein
LLIGRENLEKDEIENNKNGVEIADCEEFFLNYTNRWAVSLHSANLIVDRATIETANIY